MPPAAEQGRVERAAAQADRPSALARVLDTSAGRNLGLVAVLVVLCVIGLATADTFATTSNLLTILTSASIIGVITVGVTFVIIGGGIDLSVGKVMALASVWATTLATQSYGPAVMVFCALAVGAGCGLVNGVLIAYGRIVPFIATLAMLISAQGLASGSPASAARSSPTRPSPRSRPPACSASRCWSTSSPRSWPSGGCCSTARPSGGGRSRSAATRRPRGSPACTCAGTPCCST